MKNKLFEAIKRIKKNHLPPIVWSIERGWLGGFVFLIGDAGPPDKIFCRRFNDFEEGIKWFIETYIEKYECYDSVRKFKRWWKRQQREKK